MEFQHFTKMKQEISHCHSLSFLTPHIYLWNTSGVHREYRRCSYCNNYHWFWTLHFEVSGHLSINVALPLTQLSRWMSYKIEDKNYPQSTDYFLNQDLNLLSNAVKLSIYTRALWGFISFCIQLLVPLRETAVFNTPTLASILRCIFPLGVILILNL